MKQLGQWFEGYTASAGLADLEVSLGLAITESAKDYEQHYEELVDSRVASAAVWARYYSGFCLLALVSIAFIFTTTPTTRDLLLPIGLLTSAFIARCGWEAQIEGAVYGRLRFAIDCGIVSGVKRREEAAGKDKSPDLEALTSGWNHTGGPPADEDRHARRLALELKLASEFVMLPPPFLPYQHFWALHYVRAIWPFKGAGCLPLMQNSVFREWFVQSLRPSRDRSNDGENASPIRGDMGAVAEDLFRELISHVAKEAGTVDVLYRQHMDLVEGIDFPLWVPDDRLVARLFRKCVLLAKWPFPKLFLVDELRRYPVSGINSRRPSRPEKQPLREWGARKRVD